jgi:hypothetical protein
MSTMRIRPVPMYVRDAIFEPRPDGSLIVRMPEPREPYPHRPRWRTDIRSSRYALDIAKGFESLAELPEQR